MSTAIDTMSNTTKKQLAATTTALLGVFAFQPPAAAEQKFQRRAGAQIQARFPGMELMDEAHWGKIFERNGTLTITSMGHKSAGKWRIQKDQLCLDTGQELGSGCYAPCCKSLRKADDRSRIASMSTRGNPTKRRLRGTALACLAVATLGLSAAAEEKFQKLTGGQIRGKLAGMELTDNVHWRDFYQGNGTVMSSSMGRKRTGKWLVEKNQLCIEFEKEPIPTCYDVWLSGKQVELRREGLLPLQGTLEPSSGAN